MEGSPAHSLPHSRRHQQSSSWIWSKQSLSSPNTMPTYSEACHWLRRPTKTLHEDKQWWLHFVEILNWMNYMHIFCVIRPLKKMRCGEFGNQAVMLHNRHWNKPENYQSSTLQPGGTQTPTEFDIKWRHWHEEVDRCLQDNSFASNPHLELIAKVRSP